MTIIIIIVLALMIMFLPTLRCIILNPLSTLKYGVIDFYKYLKYMRWNECKTGEIIAFVGLFGKGKTLSLIHKVVKLYNKYNDKKIYDIHLKKWVTQKVHIISNVELRIPYTKFESMKQIVDVADNQAIIDKHLNIRTITIVVGDEFSVQMNSREFKSNFNPLLLNTILTCRHHHITLLYSAQRFNHVDCLLRQVTSYVIDCDKLWRIQRQGKYDAWEMENATSIQLLKPKMRTAWFVKNKDYEAYDTLACVGSLQKSWEEGDMLSEEEILNLTTGNPLGVDGVVQPSKKYIKIRKKMTKK